MTVLVTPPVDGEASEGGSRAWRDTVRAYVALTKPRIIEQLLVTTVPAMMLAARGWPSTWLVLATLVGGTMAAGAANTINCYVDRDIDQLMKRTSARPLVRHQVTPVNALRFGLVLTVLSTLLMGLTVNWYAAALTDAAIAFYVFVYTLGLKRRTPSNIVIGGAAGCFPVLIGWVGVTGRLALAPFVLFAVVFFWTPPHFWALAMKFKDDYAAAGVPMLPVVADASTVARKILTYTWLTVASSLLLVPIARTGWVYAAVASIAGAVFLVEAYRLSDLVRAGGSIRPMRLFHFSNTYLTLLFAGIAASALLL
jgi:protoheme IX farnesyltransferase